MFYSKSLSKLSYFAQIQDFDIIKRLMFVQNLYALKNANVAQLAEQLTRNEQVTGSNPVVGSIL